LKFTFDLQLFGGGKGSSTTTTTRNIPDQTSTEANAENQYANYANNASTAANNALSTYNSSLGSTVNPDYSSLYNTYANTMNGIQNNYSSLANGELPSSYATNEQNALNSQLQGTVGSAISNLGSRGILNSSVTNSALNNISQNAANTLASNYSSDLANYAGLLNNQASEAAQPLSTAASTQQSSYYQPETSLSNAGNLSSSNSNLFNTLYNGRMGTAGTTTTQSNSGGGFLGSLGSLVGLGISNSGFGTNWFR
jgi:hypothetical protein